MYLIYNWSKHMNMKELSKDTAGQTVVGEPQDSIVSLTGYQLGCSFSTVYAVIFLQFCSTLFTLSHLR